MRILLYNQNHSELKKISEDVIKALENEKAMLDVSYSFYHDKKKLNHVVYDIGIIDLSYGKEDALFLSHHLKQKNSECMIILLGSDYRESMYAFDIKASYFALKEDCDIKSILKNIITIYKKNNPWVYIKKDDKKYKIYIKDIIYIEVASKSITLVCTNQRYMCLRRENSDLLEILNKYNFMKIHQSYYININKVLSFKKGEVTLMNNDIISVSLKYRESFNEKIRNCINEY